MDMAVLGRLFFNDITNMAQRVTFYIDGFKVAVGTGTWGIAAVIPKYLSLRLRAKSTLKKQFPIKKFGRFNKKHYLCTH